jgi:hypothetical protein
MSGRAGLKTWKGWSLYLEGLVFIPGRAGLYIWKGCFLYLEGPAHFCLVSGRRLLGLGRESTFRKGTGNKKYNSKN